MTSNKEELMAVFDVSAEGEQAMMHLSMAMYSAIYTSLVEDWENGHSPENNEQRELFKTSIMPLFRNAQIRLPDYIAPVRGFDEQALEQARQMYNVMGLADRKKLFDMMLPKALIDSRTHFPSSALEL